MVAIIGGNGLGLNESSLASLGRFGAGQTGTAGQGQSGERVYVNAANGNLVLQSVDGRLVGPGTDAVDLRTYNSEGLANFTNNNAWMNGQYKSVVPQGTGLRRTESDGSFTDFAWNGPICVETYDPGRPADTIKLVGSNYVWTSGSTGATETYQGSGKGLITAAQDSSGLGVSYGYTGDLLTNVTSSDGEKVVLTYSGNNLTQMTTTNVSGGLLSQVGYTYLADGTNRLSTVSVTLNPLADTNVGSGETLTKYTTTYTYDGTSNRVASIVQPDGTRISFTYVLASGVYKIATVTDGNGALTQFAYAAGSTTVTDPYGVIDKYSYESSGQLTQVLMGVTAANPSGLSQANYTYNGRGEVLTIADGVGRVTTMTYDGIGNLLTQVDSAGNTITRTYNGANQLQTESTYATPVKGGTAASNPMTSRYVYSATDATLLRYAISQEGSVTEYRYLQGRRTSCIKYASGLYPIINYALTDIAGESDVQAWVATQNLTQAIRTDYSYDLRGQLKTATTYDTTDASGNGIPATASTVACVYDPQGNLIQTITPDGKDINLMVYDGLGRVVMVKESSSDATLTKTTLTLYDEAHGKVAITQANGLSTTSAFDATGRLVSIAQASGATNLGTTYYQYDQDGQLLMTTDPTGRHTWAFYDAAGRKTGEVDPAGGVTEYKYNAANQITLTVHYATSLTSSVLATLVDGNGKATTSLSGAVTLASIRPAANASDQKAWNYYDAAGRLVMQVDGMGYATATEYDGASRILSVTRYSQAVATGSLGDGLGTAPVPTANSAADRETSYVYNREGLLRLAIDGEGYATEYVYNAASQLIQTVAYANGVPGFTNADSIATQLGTARSSRVLTGLLTKDATKDISTYTFYNSEGQVVGTVDGNGYLTETLYDVNGRVSGTKRYGNLAVGPVTTASTLAALRPNPTGEIQTTSTTWDDLGRVKTQTNVEGTVTQYTYDGMGRLVRTVTALGVAADQRIGALQYDALGRVTAELTGVGAAKLTGTPAADALIWTQYATTYTYDAAGRRTSAIDALGHKTIYLYDDAGRIRFTVDAGGHIVDTQYDALGHIKSTTNVAQILSGTNLTGLVGGLLSASPSSAAVLAAAEGTLPSQNSLRTLTYDAAGMLTRSVQDRLVAGDGLGGTTSWTYDAFGEATRSTRTLDATHSVMDGSTFDRRGLQTHSKADDGGLALDTGITYDAFGRATDTKDPLGNITHRDYDKLGQVVTLKDPLGKSAWTTYDAFNRVLTQKDALLHTTSYSYDTAARSVTLTTAEGIQVVTKHTRDGQVLSIQDGNKNITSYTYDEDGHLKTTTLPAGLPGVGSINNTYDVLGNLLTTTDNNGTVVGYTYDAVNRILTRTVDPGTGTHLNLVTQYGYDSVPNRVVVTDPRLVVTYIDHDLLGETTTQTVDPAGLNIQTIYTRDQLGRTLTVTTGKTPTEAGTTTRYDYDNAGRRIDTIVDPGHLNLTTAYTYDEDGNVRAVTDPTGAVTRYTYDADNRLVRTVDGAGGVTQTIYDDAGRVFQVLRYGVAINLSGLALKVTSAQVDGLVAAAVNQRTITETRGYDKDNRLTFTVDGAGGVRWFKYDTNGNVVKQISFAAPITPPLPGASASDLALAVQTLVQNAAPYATEDVADAVVRRVFDAANRVVLSQEGYSGVTGFTYDGAGNLVKKVLYVSGPTVWADLTTAPAADPLDRVTLIAYDRAGRAQFTVDALGGVTEAVYDGNGNIVKRIAYATAAAALPTTSSAPLDASTFVRPGTSANDRTTRAIYDGAGRQVYQMGATGAVVRTYFDGNGRVTGQTAYARALAPATELASIPLLAKPSDMLPVITSSTNPDDRTTIQVYDAAGRQVYTVDALGYVTGNTCNALGQVTQTVLFGLPVTGLKVGVAADTLKAQLPTPAWSSTTVDRISTFGYDAAGRLTSSTDALNHTESYEYDGVGNKTKFTNKNQAVWTYAYDAMGRLVTETTPQVAVTTLTQNATTGSLSAGATVNMAIVNKLTYDALGNLQSRTEAVGTPSARTTNYGYDRLGNQISITYPPVGVYLASDLANLTLDAAGASGRKESVQTLSTQVIYNTFQEAISSRDVGGNVSGKVYDKLGRVIYDIDAMGGLTEYVRNIFGDVESLTRYASAVAPMSIPSLAAVLTAKAAVNFSAGSRTIRTSYDLLGQAIRVEQPSTWVNNGIGQGYNAKAVTKTTYNAFGEVATASVLADAPNGEGGALTVWAVTTNYYDALGQLVATIDPMGYVTTQAYDGAGNLTRRTEFAKASAGYVPGTANAGPAVDATDRTTTYRYDLLNRQTTMTYVGITYSITTDGLNLATPSNISIVNAYDAVGNCTLTIDAAGGYTTTQFDALGRITSVRSPSQGSAKSGYTWTPTTKFQRDAMGNVVLQIQTATSTSISTYTSMTSAQTLTTGQTLGDPSGKFVLTLLAGGNLVILDHLTGATVWSSNTAGTLATQLRISSDGDLGLYVGAATTPVWHTGTTWTPGATLVMGSDGHLVLQTTATGEALWKSVPATAEPAVSVADTQIAGQSLAKYGTLLQGQNLDSTAGVFRTTLKADGNLVIINRQTGLEVWSSGTAGSGADRLTFRPDGDLILSAGTTTVWASGTSGKAGAYLVMQKSGNLVMYASDGSVLWDSSMTKTIESGRFTYAGFDALGRVISQTDAQGFTHFMSYDAVGHLAKTWQPVTGQDGIHCQYTAFTYDALGRQTGILTPATTSVLGTVTGDTLEYETPITTLTQAAAGSMLTSIGYNAFGEVTSRGNAHQGSAPTFSETYEYDQAGRVWRTNAQDGVTKVYLYNLQGFQTASITSAGVVSSTSAGLDLSKVASAALVDGRDPNLPLNLTTGGVRRTDNKLDLLGRVLQQTLPGRTNYVDTGTIRPSVQQTFDRWGNILSQTDVRNVSWLTFYSYNFRNQITSQSLPYGNGVPQTRYCYNARGDQVAVVDARGFVNGQVWDAGGNLIEELHADGGVVYRDYDAFGDQVRITSAENRVTTYGFDMLGRNTTIAHAGMGVYSSPDGTTVTGSENQTVTTTMVYDEMGRKVREINGAGNVQSYAYDLRGNIIASTDALNFVTRSAFNDRDQMSAQFDAAHTLNTWSYFGDGTLSTHHWMNPVQSSTGLDNNGNPIPGSGKYFVRDSWEFFTYDYAGQLMTQAIFIDSDQHALRTYDQRLTRTYSYDAAGELNKSVEVSLDYTKTGFDTTKTTKYQFNAAGAKTHETMIQGNATNTTADVTYQDQAMTYDQYGQLATITALDGLTLSYTYDKVGNKLSTTVNRVSITGVSSTQVLYSAYDEMNRQILVDGLTAASAGVVDPSGLADASITGLGGTSSTWTSNGTVLTSTANRTPGHIITYDMDGNRVADKTYGTQVVVKYGTAGTWTSSTPIYSVGSRTGTLTTFYTYDGMNRLSTVGTGSFDMNGNLLTKDAAFIVDKRQYDGASRLVRQGVPTSLPSSYLNAVGANPDSSLVSNTVSKYDAAGQVISQHVANLKTAANGNDTTFYYDGTGNRYCYEVVQGNAHIRYTISMAVISGGYKESSVWDNTWLDGDAQHQNAEGLYDTFDGAGNLVKLENYQDSSETRTLVNDSSGRVLQKTDSAGKVTRELIVNGEVIGRYGKNGTTGDSDWDFDLAYAPISAANPAAATGNYPVQPGDTLEGIALSAYGDSSLWYVIAEANGLSGDQDLRVGQILTIPNQTGSVHNTSETRAPYDPSKIVGSSTPDVPIPQPSAGDAGCGIVGTVIMIVVAAVVTYYTAGLATGWVAGAMGPIVAGAVGGAAGSIASQGVGMALGIQDKFSWEQVGLSALGGAVSGGINGVNVNGGNVGAIQTGQLAGTGFEAVVGRAVVTNAMTQGLSVAMKMQDHFSWSGVAAAAASAGAGRLVGDKLGLGSGSDLSRTGTFAAQAASGFVAGVSAAAMHRGKIDITRAAVDAFGNALGSAVEDGLDSAQRMAVIQRISGGHIETVEVPEVSLPPDLIKPLEMPAIAVMNSGVGTDTTISAGDGGSGSMGRGSTLLQTDGSGLYSVSGGPSPNALPMPNGASGISDDQINRYLHSQGYSLGRDGQNYTDFANIIRNELQDGTFDPSLAELTQYQSKGPQGLSSLNRELDLSNSSHIGPLGEAALLEYNYVAKPVAATAYAMMGGELVGAALPEAVPGALASAAESAAGGTIFRTMTGGEVTPGTVLTDAAFGAGLFYGSKGVGMAFDYIKNDLLPGPLSDLWDQATAWANQGYTAYHNSPLSSEVGAVSFGPEGVNNGVVSDSALTVGDYTYTRTAGSHLGDFVKKGDFSGELARPYMTSPTTIQEIQATGSGVSDPGGIPGALRYDVSGSFRGSQGTWELVVHPETKTIFHFNFVN